jgi:hypothetical protein
MAELFEETETDEDQVWKKIFILSTVYKYSVLRRVWCWKVPPITMWRKKKESGYEYSGKYVTYYILNTYAQN